MRIGRIKAMTVAFLLASGLTLASGMSANAAPAEGPEVHPLTLAEVEADGGYTLLAVNGIPVTGASSSASKTMTIQSKEGEDATGTRATCTYSGGVTKTYDWTGKKPKTCGQLYRLYKNGKVVLTVNNTSSPGFWGIASQGYTAVNKWCSTNSFTCALVTSAGFAVLAATNWMNA